MAAKGHGGRPSSWLVVFVILVGFTVSGVALIMGPHWVMFWAGGGIIVAGGVLGAFVDIFADVVLDTPRQMRADNQQAQVPAGNH
jgi:hypothetical protein